MTMPNWLARPLRRFAGTAAMMMFGGQAFVHGLLYPGPDMPPRDADRVIASMPGGDTVRISDQAAVRRIAAFVRARDDVFIRVSDDRDHFWHMRTLCFHRGPVEFPCVRFSAEGMIIDAGHDVLLYKLTPADAAHLERLLAEGITASQR